MKTKNIFYFASTVVLGGSLLFSSCKKKEKEDSDTDAAQDHAMAETQSNDIVNIGDQASTGATSTYRLAHPDENIYSSGCATIKRDTVNSTDNDTLLVDFGSGCQGLDGRTRSGSLQYIYSAGKHYRDSGNVINVSSNNYIVDGNKINIISKTITNVGHVNGQLNWNITANISITKANGKTHSWTTTKTKVLLQGENGVHHIDWPNAKVAIYGTASGTSANGETFTANVAQATWLVRDFTCTSYRRCFVSGELDLTPSGKQTRHINFGNGACDNVATVTINGNVYNITLH